MKKMATIILMTSCILYVLDTWASTNANIVVIQLPVDSTGQQPSVGLLSRINRKISSVQNKMDQKTEKALSTMSRQESKMLAKIRKRNPAAADQLLNDPSAINYQELQQKYSSANNAPLKEYLPHVDSLGTSLKFLQESPGSPADGSLKHTAAVVSSNLQQVQGKLGSAEQMETLIKSRRDAFKEQLSNLGMLKELKAYNKQAYYYKEQMNEYKAMLNDSKKMEQKLISVLSKNALYKSFLQKNSMLAQLFSLPQDYGSAASLEGLQTRAQVQSVVLQRLGGGGADATQYLNQSMQTAKAQIAKLADQVNSQASGGKDFSMPGFTPNQQKTKPFLSRLEVGLNIQSAKSNIWFPTSSDIGLSIGYKINGKSILGVGAAYKMGWGKDIHHIVVTNEGIGVRTFVDWKLKGSFYASGGYEKNYNFQFKNLNNLGFNSPQWSNSALIGISKKYKLGSRKGELKLLYDVLHNQNHNNPILFRTGFSLK
jgi:hypothetical protein